MIWKRMGNRDVKPAGEVEALCSVPPPEQIGPLLSFSSSKDTSEDIVLLTPAFFKGVAIAALLMGVGHGVVIHYQWFQVPVYIMVMGGLGLLAVLLSVCAGSREYCEYVGEKGAARYTRIRGEAGFTDETLLFSKVEYLLRHYRPHVEPAGYLSHDIDEEACRFSWLDGLFNTRFEISGINMHDDYPSFLQSGYLFGCAVEKAWTHYLTRTQGAGIRADRLIFFPLAWERGWLSFESNNLRYQVDGVGGVRPFGEIVGITRTHNQLILAFSPDRNGAEGGRLHISLENFPNNRFFFSMLELYSGLRAPKWRLLPSEKSGRVNGPGPFVDPDLFKTQLNYAASYHERLGADLLLLVVEVNNTVFINHRHGRQIGTGVLSAVGHGLREMVRGKEESVLARMEGTEFAAILPEFQPGTGETAYIDRVRQRLNRPVLVNGVQCHPQVHVGHGLYPRDGKRADSLLRVARTRMYGEKYRALFNLERSVPASG